MELQKSSDKNDNMGGLHVGSEDGGACLSYYYKTLWQWYDAP